MLSHLSEQCLGRRSLAHPAPPSFDIFSRLNLVRKLQTVLDEEDPRNMEQVNQAIGLVTLR